MNNPNLPADMVGGAVAAAPGFHAADFGSVQTQGIGKNAERPLSGVAQEHDKAIAFHQEHLLRNHRAADFLRANPSFAEFVDLVRRGIIQF